MVGCNSEGATLARATYSEDAALGFDVFREDGVISLRPNDGRL